MSTVALVLAKKRPTDGKPNPYRTRWAVAGGVLWTISADTLNAPWFVEADLDSLIHAGDSEAGAEQRRAARAELHAYIRAENRPCEIVTNIAAARAYITESITAAGWPQHRDTWRQLAEARGVDLTNIPLEG